MTQNWQYRILALLLAVISWYLVSGQEKVETWLEVPLEFVNIPAKMELTSGLVSKVQVRIRGTTSQVRALNAERLAYTLNLSNLQIGQNTVPMVPEGIAVPSPVEVVEISPSRLVLQADVMLTKRVPVRLDWRGKPGKDLLLKNATLAPESVELFGFASLLHSVTSVETERVLVPENGERQISGQAKILLPPQTRCSLSTVAYTLTYGPETQEIWVKIPLEAVPAAEGYIYTFEPNFVRAKFIIPVVMLRNKDWRGALHMHVDPGQTPTLGMQQLVPRGTFPQDVRLLELKPENIEVVVKKTDKERED